MNPFEIICVCVQLRGGREGMCKIKSIIHAKLKARSLTPNMLKKKVLIETSILMFLFPLSHVLPLGFESLVGVQLADSGWKEKTFQRPKGKGGEKGLYTHACMCIITCVKHLCKHWHHMILIQSIPTPTVWEVALKKRYFLSCKQTHWKHLWATLCRHQFFFYL